MPCLTTASLHSTNWTSNNNKNVQWLMSPVGSVEVTPWVWKAAERQSGSRDRGKPQMTFWASSKQRNNFKHLITVTRQHICLRCLKRNGGFKHWFQWKFVSLDDAGSNVKSLNLRMISLRIWFVDNFEHLIFLLYWPYLFYMDSHQELSKFLRPRFWMQDVQHKLWKTFCWFSPRL